MPDAMSQFAFWNGRNLIHHKPRDRGKSVLIAWLDHYSKERRFGLVACKDTDRDGSCCVEAIILDNHRRPRFTGVIFASCDRPNLTSLQSIPRDCINEILILLSMCTARHHQRLAMCLRLECSRSGIRHPDLQRP